MSIKTMTTEPIVLHTKSAQLAKQARRDADEFISANTADPTILGAIIETGDMDDAQRREFAAAYRTALRTTHPTLTVTKRKELVAISLRPSEPQLDLAAIEAEVAEQDAAEVTQTNGRKKA
ncbi:hypothetical protein CCP3SC15_1240006 [Gammaproteobacteria bacterium]